MNYTKQLSHSKLTIFTEQLIHLFESCHLRHSENLYLTPYKCFFNQFMMNGLSHYYHLGESLLGASDVILIFLFHLSMKFKANRIAPDEMPSSAASHLRLYCLPISHK